MCGRYAQFSSAQELSDVFNVQVCTPECAQLLPSWNVAPTQAVRIVRETVLGPERAVRTLELARWGLVPSWAKDPTIGTRLINARVETVTQKPSYRGPIRYSRCLVPADGYYEWQAPAPGARLKTPHYLRRVDGAPLAFAGLAALWREELLTCTIITGPARAELAHIHDREPLQIPDDAVSTWLDPDLTDAEEASALLSGERPALTAHVVSREVNAVRNNTPHLIEPVHS
ncbi:MAG: SOS response-associated peptidase [Bowdeniella nasicola]|nr:SOS response-associated peptidase [Bowdeniella nasicola]